MAKSAITVEIDDKIREQLKKRAKKEVLSLKELIVDILRRSVVSYKKSKGSEDKVDDKILTFFSRKK
tara:strand:- start:2059 stop:2259 length:201 start_codon:yes stop_codon:yes gene_type:complete